MVGLESAVSRVIVTRFGFGRTVSTVYCYYSTSRAQCEVTSSPSPSTTLVLSSVSTSAKNAPGTCVSSCPVSTSLTAHGILSRWTGNYYFCFCHAFVSNRLDNCNSLLVKCQQPIPTKAPNHPERCRSSCYRSQKIRAYITHLRDLHWLPVRRRITFKTAVLVYKCLHDMAPQYLQAYCEPTSTVGTRRLRSAHSGRLTVPRTRTSYGDRSFAVQGPRVWNSLPAALRAPDITLTTFRNKLKTFLFNV